MHSAIDIYRYNTQVGEIEISTARAKVQIISKKYGMQPRFVVP